MWNYRICVCEPNSDVFFLIYRKSSKWLLGKQWKCLFFQDNNLRQPVLRWNRFHRFYSFNKKTKSLCGWYHYSLIRNELWLIWKIINFFFKSINLQTILKELNQPKNLMHESLQIQFNFLYIYFTTTIS